MQFIVCASGHDHGHLGVCSPCSTSVLATTAAQHSTSHQMEFEACLHAWMLTA